MNRIFSNILVRRRKDRNLFIGMNDTSKIIPQTYVWFKFESKFYNIGKEGMHRKIPCRTVRLAACGAKAARTDGCGISGSDAAL